MKPLYLPGLNGVRAVACLMVFYTHFYAFLGNTYSLTFRNIDLSNFGVTCFFCLSGFLITTLLLREKEKNNGIDFKRFYIRRILRIWPLYFLIVLIGVIYFIRYHPAGEKPSYFLFFIFFSGNLAFVLARTIWIINPLWSVCVEEQFYAMWPFLINSVKILRNLVIFIVGFLLLKVVAQRTVPLLYAFLIDTRIDCMAIGGIFAYINFKRSLLVKFLFHKIVQLIAWIIFITSFIIPFHVKSLIDQELFSIIVGIIIINISFNPGTILSLENRVLHYIGKISYGIYAFHVPVIFIWRACVPVSLVSRIPFHDYSLPFILLGITLLVAHVSYFYFESRFLHLKDKYSIVRTSTN
jgi:peptidoglycan/LPS O-acetylase OafA/YrhL